jgi:hypothetical protein
MNDVNIELGKTSSSIITLNDADVRALAGVSSGTISMDDLRGKSAGSPPPPDGVFYYNAPGDPGPTFSWNFRFAQRGTSSALTVFYNDITVFSESPFSRTVDSIVSPIDNRTYERGEAIFSTRMRARHEVKRVPI